MLDISLRFIARDLQNLLIPQNIGYPQSRQTRLFCTEKLARTTQPQIHFRDVEAVARFHHRPDTLFAGIIQPSSYQDAVALLGAPAHPPTKLMQLRQTEALGLFDYHY